VNIKLGFSEPQYLRVLTMNITIKNSLKIKIFKMKKNSKKIRIIKKTKRIYQALN
jgi:hypothetical protein